MRVQALYQMISRRPEQPNPDGHLPWWRAIADAFVGNRSIEFYPRLTDAGGGEPRSYASGEIITAAVDEIKKWPAELSEHKLEHALARARESLDEVKAQTEYQDQKATRLLTVATFLTALSGVLFNKFSESYPIRATFGGEPSIGWVLVPAAYVAFGIFVLSAVCGAIVTFHATRTRFKYPQAHREEISKQESDPKSMLFYEAILRVSPGAWTRAFVDLPLRSQTAASAKSKFVERAYTRLFNEPQAPNIRPDLQTRYLQNYVTESYLNNRLGYEPAKKWPEHETSEPTSRLLSIPTNRLWSLTAADDRGPGTSVRNQGHRANDGCRCARNFVVTSYSR